jgi:hypothetical protein
MTVQQLIDSLKDFPPDSELFLALAISIGGFPAYRRGHLTGVKYLPKSFYGPTKILCIMGETENGNQSALGSVQQ